MRKKKKEMQNQEEISNRIDPQNNSQQGVLPETKLKKSTLNREIAAVTYIFIGLFALLIGYFVNFLAKDNTEILNNPYNKRQDLLAQRVTRGKILGSDGEILAETIVNKKGEEVRSYPYNSMFSHIVGRLSKGKTGVEASQNVLLLTSSINPLSALINEFQGKKNPSDNVRTTLHVKLQKAAYESLGSRKGAVVVLDPKSGEILAMVSKPDYDPNRIDDEWEKLLAKGEEESALLNRATQGLYPPGSTFKILTALEYIRENKNYEDFSYECNGTAVFQGVKINCYNNKKHGKLNLNSAFAKSCNGAFAEIGLGLDLNAFKELCKDMLFNVSLPIPIEYNISSFSLEQGTETSDIAQSSIGQGKTLMSPLHNALITAAIANKGVLMAPYVIDSYENEDGHVNKSFELSKKIRLMSKGEAKILYQMMKETVKYGTGASLNSSKYEAGGKTGSAEINSSRTSHAWFVGIGKKGEKQIVVSIIVEEAGTGSDHAVPIAKKIFDAWQ